MTDWTPLLTTLGIAIPATLTLLGVVISKRAQERQSAADRAVELIDDYRQQTLDARADAQKAIKDVRATLAQQDEAITDLRRRLNLVEARERVLLDYAHRLRAHIDRELGPPAPPWPDILIT